MQFTYTLRIPYHKTSGRAITVPVSCVLTKANGRSVNFGSANKALALTMNGTLELTAVSNVNLASDTGAISASVAMTDAIDASVYLRQGIERNQYNVEVVVQPDAILTISTPGVADVQYRFTAPSTNSMAWNKSSTAQLTKTFSLGYSAGGTIPDYTACIAPSSVTAATTNVAPGAVVRISWSGASAGTGMNIASYTVYRSSDGANWSVLQSGVTVSYLDVSAPESNGAVYYYAVETVGSVAGYNSQRSTAIASLTCYYTAPSVSSVLIDSSSSDAVVAPSSSHTLSWTGTNGTNNAITQYLVYRNGEYVGATTSTSYSVSSPSAGSSFQFSVLPVGTYSNGGAVASPVVYSYGAVGAPTAISVTSNNGGKPGASEVLSWSGASAGAYNAIVGYQIYRSTSFGGSYSLLATVTTGNSYGSYSVTAPSYSTGTTSGLYTYKVVTVGQKSNSGYSPEAGLYYQVTAPVFTSYSSALYLRAGEAGNIVWTSDNGRNNAITGYEVYKDGVKVTTVTTGSYAITAGQTGNHNVYTIVPLGTYLNGSGVAVDLYVYATPSAPTGVAITPSVVDAGAGATLSWNSVSDATYNAITQYYIYKNGSHIASVARGVTSYALTAPSAMGAYDSYCVVAQGVHYGSSAESSTVTLTARVYTAPTAPTVSVDSSVVTKGNTTTLRWSGAQGGTNNPITGYEVYRSTSQDGSYTLLGTYTGNALTVACPDAYGAYYWFKVRAVATKAGYLYSGYSSAVSVQTMPYTNCVAPSSVTISATLANPGTSITIGWSGAKAGENNAIAGYRVYRKIGSGDYTLYKTLGSTASSTTDTVVASGNAMSYKVVTVGSVSGYDSLDSAIVTCLSNTPPSAVSFTSDNPSIYESGAILIEWNGATDVDNAVSGYVLQRKIGTGAWVNIYSGANRYYSDTPTVDRGTTFMYQVCAYDALGLPGAFTQSKTFTRNRLPQAPTIVFPATGMTSYSQYPHLCVSVPAELDNQPQAIMAKVDSGEWTSLMNNASAGNRIVQLASPVSVGTHTVKVAMRDSLGAYSTEVSISLTVASPSWARTIASGTIISSASISHQDEIEQLYERVNAVREYVGLSDIDVPDSIGSAYSNYSSSKIGAFAAWGTQMQNLVNALNEALIKCGMYVSWTPLTAGMMPVASVINELRTRIESV